MKLTFAGALAAISIVLGGCATPPQTPVELAPTALNSQGLRVGVIMSSIPKIDVQLPGASCLLCLAAASIANSSLSKHAESLTAEDLPQLKDKVAELVQKKGATVTIIPETINIKDLSSFSGKGPNVAEEDYSAMKQKYNIDKLVVVNITSLGFIRTYSSYFPTSDPKATITGSSYLVNLSNNTYEWYNPISIMKSADKWDEAPNFPGLSNAYYQVIEMGKDVVLKPLAN